MDDGLVGPQGARLRGSTQRTGVELYLDELMAEQNMTSLDAATALKSAVCIKTYILSQIFPHHLHNITSPTYSSLIQHFHLGAVTWRTRVLLQRCARRTASFSAETEARGGGPRKVKAPVAVATARMERTDISEVFRCAIFFSEAGSRFHGLNIRSLRRFKI